MDLASRQASVLEARAAIEAARKAMRKKLPPPENTLSQPGPSQNSGQDFLSPEDYVEQDEIFKVLGSCYPSLFILSVSYSCRKNADAQFKRKFEPTHP